MVPKQLRNRGDVGAVLEAKCGNGVANGMGTEALCQTGMAGRSLGGFVGDAGVNLMTACDTGVRIYGEVLGR